MSVPALVTIVAVVVVLAALILMQQRRAQPRAAARPECTLEEAWAHYFDHPAEAPARDQAASAGLGSAREEAAQRLLPRLEATAAEALASAEPLVVLRQAIMDASERFIMVETLYDPEASGGEGQVSAESYDAVVEAGVLRRFSGLRFGDAGPDDWYAHYLRVAEMHSRNVNAMMQKTLAGEASSLESSLHAPLVETMRDAREALLRHPPQTPVSRATHLAAGSQPERHAPSQRQIDRLTEILSEHFERLFAGQVYRHRGALVDPVAAFEVDAAILHAVLALRFRHPTEAWRRILVGALGGRGEVVATEGDTLLAVAHKVRRTWQGSGEGRFGLALQTACREVFSTSGRTQPEDLEALAEDMLEDAAALVGSIQDVTRQED